MEAKQKPEERILGKDIPAYMIELLLAGSGTTAITLLILFFNLMLHSEKQDKLRKELMGAFPDKTNIDLRKTIELPYVDAVIRETMRWQPVVPGPQERILGDSLEINGYRIPPGVTASTSPYDQAHLEDVYPEADEWKPERWLGKPTERMQLNCTDPSTSKKHLTGPGLIHAI